MTLTDAGPLIAIIDARDAYHEQCVAALPDLSAPLISTGAAVTEAMHLLGHRAGWPAQERLWRLMRRGDLDVLALDGDTSECVFQLMKKYRDVPMDFADATLVATAENLGISRIFTLDEHFRIYRMLGRRAFELMPA